MKNAQPVMNFYNFLPFLILGILIDFNLSTIDFFSAISSSLSNSSKSSIESGNYS